MRRSVLFNLFLLMLLIGLTGSAWAKSVTLSWDASPSEVSGYKVYYKAGSSDLPLDGTGAAEGGSPITVGNVLTFTVTGLPDAAEHYFAVTAYDAANYESSYSNTVLSPAGTGENTTTNSAPQLATIGNKSVPEGSPLIFTLSATDAEADTLTYSVQGLPSGAVFNSASQSFRWTPSFSQAGIFTVTFTVSDGNLSDSEAITISVGNANQAPVLNSIGTKTISEGAELNFTISGSDPDSDGLTYSAMNLPDGATFNPATRQFNWTPGFEVTSNTRVYPVDFKVSDGALNDSETVTINVSNVNRPPVLAAIGAQSLLEGDSINLVLSASDPDGETLTYSATNLPTGAVFISATQSFSWIPDNTQTGSYNVTFKVADSEVSDSETVTIRVVNANEAPVLDTIGEQSINEQSQLRFVVTASDANADNLTYSASGIPPGASFDPTTQVFTWTPDYTQAGNYSITFSVTDSLLTDSETVAIAVVNVNQAPTISGSSTTALMARTAYAFTPTANDPDGDRLAFTISNKPVWAAFDPTTGQLTGAPTDSDAGSHADITISVSDGIDAAALPSFTIIVEAFAMVDSDGDGVLDQLDAFPNDASEWLDTDGDLIGNNADTDDDGDNVADERDGSPLDADKAGWIITAAAGTGGFITPDGETSVLYGGSITYELMPKAGYSVNDLLVDNVSVGAVGSYQFVDVAAHHSIDAVFAELPKGLNVLPTEVGLSGVDRLDGGDDSNNLVSGQPKLDLDYRFQIVLRDSVTAGQRKVYLVLDGYRYLMQLSSGSLVDGATYTFKTRLGPAYAHSFHFVAVDAAGVQTSRYPVSGELPGPRVELLNGKNVIGIPGNLAGAGLDSSTAFNVTQAYRWIPSDTSNGRYEKVDSGGPVLAGEGYVLKRTADGTLPSLDGYGEVTSSSFEIPITAGWNLIANPYKGNIALSDVQVKYGDSDPVGWLSAVADNRIIDGIYYYLGKDWGNTNNFSSAASAEPAIMTPWIGYWVYLNPTDQPVLLLIPKPQQ